MTRLEQAMRWWRNHEWGDVVTIPDRHLRVLKNAGFLLAPDENEEVGLNAVGQRFLDKLEEKP